jgi:quercetin dioxygenase-like cupin family protein
MMSDTRSKEPFADDLGHAEAWSALAQGLEPEAPNGAVRARLLEQLAGPERFALFADDLSQAFRVTREAALQALRRVSDASAWRPGLLAGSQFLATDALSEARVVIARLPAGTRIPTHHHDDREITLVLQGLLIEDGRRQHGPGALLDMPAGTEHAITVSDQADCLVVFFGASPP